MVSATLSRPMVWGIVIFMALGVLLPTGELPAQSVGCIAVDSYYMPRECTFLEEHGECLWSALDSYHGCMEDTEGFWASVGCQIGVQVDLLACNLSMPLRLIKAIVDM